MKCLVSSSFSSNWVSGIGRLDFPCLGWMEVSAPEVSSYYECVVAFLESRCTHGIQTNLPGRCLIGVHMYSPKPCHKNTGFHNINLLLTYILFNSLQVE